MVTQPRSLVARPGNQDRLLALLRPAHGDFGPFTMLALVILDAVLWIALRPAGEPWRRHIGQLFGAESVLLLTMALVRISTLPWIETRFHGIDRAAIWHRRAVIVGLVLLGPHILLASNPNGSTLGGPLAAIGAAGLVTLALWSVLPRWRVMLPAALRDPILVLRDTAPGRLVRDVIDNTNGGAWFTGRPASSSRRDSCTGCSMRLPSMRHRRCGGAMSRSVGSVSPSTSIARFWLATSFRFTTTRSRP